jgi:hypothetical protein
MDRRQADARASQWLLEVDRALLALRRGDTDAPVAQDVPAEAGPRNSRSGTTRYSAPADQPAAAMTAVPNGRGTDTSVGEVAVAAVAHPEGRIDRDAPTIERTVKPASDDAALRHEEPKRSGSPTDGDAASLVPLAATPALAAATPTLAAASQVPVRTESAPAAGSAPATPTTSDRVTMGRHGTTATSGMTLLAANRAAKDGVGAGITGAIGLVGRTRGTVAGHLRVSAAPVTAGSKLSYVAGKAVVGTTAAIRPAFASADDAMEETEQEDERPVAHGADPPSGEPFESKHVHVDVDDGGVHAYLRDASLDTEDLLALAEAVYSQGMFGDAPLASVTINGAVIQRPLHRVARAGSPDAYEDALDDQALHPILNEKGRIAP